MDYGKTAKEILEKVGGSKNIVSAAHCATRLRLVIADNNKADKGALENIEGVKGVFEASGQLQIILGTGTVNKVFDQFIAIAGITASTKAEAKAAAAKQQNVFMRAIKLLGDIFVPIIPAIVASGFLMGIMNSLDFMINNGFINMDTSSSIYVFASLFSNTAYTFLQILIAFSAAKAFGANPYLGAVIGMIMINPSLQNAYTVATDGVLQTQSVFFGLYDIDMVGYQGHVIPVVIAVWLLSVIEKEAAQSGAGGPGSFRNAFSQRFCYRISYSCHHRSDLCMGGKCYFKCHPVDAHTAIWPWKSCYGSLVRPYSSDRNPSDVYGY